MERTECLEMLAAMHAESISMSQGAPTMEELLAIARADVERHPPSEMVCMQIDAMSRKSRAFRLAFSHASQYSHRWGEELNKRRWRDLELYLNLLFDGGMNDPMGNHHGRNQ